MREGWIDHYIEMFNHVNNIVRNKTTNNVLQKHFLLKQSDKMREILQMGFTVQEKPFYGKKNYKNPRNLFMYGDNIRYERHT